MEPIHKVESGKLDLQTITSRKFKFAAFWIEMVKGKLQLETIHK
jgi:hypothetical protein